MKSSEQFSVQRIRGFLNSMTIRISSHDPCSPLVLDDGELAPPYRRRPQANIPDEQKQFDPPAKHRVEATNGISGTV